MAPLQDRFDPPRQKKKNRKFVSRKLEENPYKTERKAPSSKKKKLLGELLFDSRLDGRRRVIARSSQAPSPNSLPLAAKPPRECPPYIARFSDPGCIVSDGLCVTKYIFHPFIVGAYIHAYFIHPDIFK